MSITFPFTVPVSERLINCTTGCRLTSSTGCHGTINSTNPCFSRSDTINNINYDGQTCDSGERYYQGMCIPNDKTKVCPTWANITSFSFISPSSGSVNCTFDAIDSTRISWDNLTTVFITDANKLTQARKLWCKMGDPTNATPNERNVMWEQIMNNDPCTKNDMITSTVNWKQTLLNLIKSVPNWYNDSVWANRFGTHVANISGTFTYNLVPDTSDVVSIALNSCISQVTSNVTFMSQPFPAPFKTALNMISNAGGVGATENQKTIAKMIKEKIIIPHCNSLGSDQGKTATECGCKNAIDGWKPNYTCTKDISGCVDVAKWIDVINSLQANPTNTIAQNSINSISIYYDPKSMSEACVKSMGDSSDVLAIGSAAAAQSQNIQICSQQIRADTGGTIEVGGNVDLSCGQNVNQTTSTNTGGSPGSPPPGTPGSPSGDGKILGLEPWLFYTLLGVVILVILGGGAAAFFLI